MKICDKHWKLMRQAIDDRGLSGLVAKDGRTAMVRTLDELKDEASPATYDPLMACHWMVTTNALKLGGLYMMGVDENGRAHCPICEAVKHLPKVAREDGTFVSAEAVEADWINGPADVALRYARENKLVAPVQ